MNWHVDRQLLQRYVAGVLDDAAAWSLESHVATCAGCRGLLGDLDDGDRPWVDDQRLEAVWHEIEWEVERPRRSAAEWMLYRVGVPEHVARLLAATRSLTASWLLSVVVVLAFAVAMAWLGAGGSVQTGTSALAPASLPYLVLAPLVPLAGIAAAFGPGVDPTYEIAVAAPLRGVRLLSLRAVAVLATSLVLTALGALLLPVLNWSAAAWVLPALAVTGVMLALSTRWDPLRSAVGVGVGWVLLVAASETASEVTLVAFRGEGQVVAAVALAVSLLALGLRRGRFDQGLAR